MTAAEQTTTDLLFAELKDDREDASQYLSIFIDEAQSTLDELIEALLALETGGGKKQVEQLFIAAHRMKGSAASIGLNRIAKLSHYMEDLMQELRDKDCIPTPQITDALLSCTDGLRQAVNNLRSGEQVDDHFPALARELLAARASFDQAGPELPDPVPAPATAQPADLPEVAAEAPAVSAAEVSDDLRRRLAGIILEEQRDDVIIGQIVFEPNLPVVGLKAQLLCSKLANVGEIRYLNPPAAEMENMDEIAAIEFAVSTDKSSDVVRNLLLVAGVQSVAVAPLGRSRPHAAVANDVRDTRDVREVRAAEPGVKPAETLRVDIERLDQLMNLAGQLVIGKARITQISERLKKSVSEKTYIEARDGVSDLFEAIHLLDRVSDGIQQGVMNMRMLPIGPLFSRSGDQRRRHGTRQADDR
jgi:two-component system, chemotaxis family, sensor kinase CheA